MRPPIDGGGARGRGTGRASRAAVFAGVAVFAWTSVRGHEVIASSGEGTIDPMGRGIQLLGGREAILLEQSDRARRVARARALALYRLLRSGTVERDDGIGNAGVRLGGRTVALATVVLERDLGEARLLRAELNRVRGERAGVNPGPVSPDVGSGTEGEPPVSLRRPVQGGVVVPFGVARDHATGAWIFRAAASYAARAGESVRSPATGRIVRVASSVAGGAAVVLAHDGGDWTSVLSGLGFVMVSAGELVQRGDPLGNAGMVASRRTVCPIRIEVWRGRTPVDPASVLRAR